MRQSNLHQARAVRAFAAAIVSSFSILLQPSFADVVWEYNNDGDFSYTITGMPDLDQRRAGEGGAMGLPGEGAMFAVPASAANILCYLNAHGFAGVLNPPPPAGAATNWQHPAAYNSAAHHILGLGNAIQIDSLQGATGRGTFEGLRQALAGHDLVVTACYASDRCHPTLSHLTRAAIGGGIIMISAGRYEIVGSSNEQPLLQRAGGHAMTLTRAQAQAGARSLRVRDSADDANDLLSQSIFCEREYLGLIDEEVAFESNGDSMAAESVKLTKLSVASSTPAGEFAIYLDGFIAVQPKSLAVISPTGTVVRVHCPVQVAGSNVPALREFNLPPGLRASSLALSPDFTEIIVVAADLSNGAHLAWRLNPLTGGLTIVPDLIEPTTAFYGRGFDLYVRDIGTDLDGGGGGGGGGGSGGAGPALKRLNLTREHPVVGQVQLQHAISAFAYDDSTDSIIGISKLDGVLVRYSADLLVGPEVFPLPAKMPPGHINAIAVDTKTGIIWGAISTSNMLIQLTLDPSDNSVQVSTVAVDGVLSVSGLDIDDAGHVFAISSGLMTEIAPDGSGDWQVQPGSPFAGISAMAMRLTRSRTNFDARSMSGPGFYNLHPDDLDFGQQIYDCVMDIAPAPGHGDGQVHVDDLLAVIAAWGECGSPPGALCHGDVAPPPPAGGDGAVNIDDLLAVIAAWGACQ